MRPVGAITDDAMQETTMIDLANQPALTHIDIFNQATDVIRELDQRTNDGLTVTTRKTP